MAESIAFSTSADRATIYAEIAPQIESLVSGEIDLIANLANVAAVLKEALGFFWVGFYVAKDGQLVLGPFQGPLACTRIDFDQGVCGHAYTMRQTTITLISFRAILFVHPNPSQRSSCRSLRAARFSASWMWTAINWVISRGLMPTVWPGS